MLYIESEQNPALILYNSMKNLIKHDLKALARSSVEETQNALIDKEADLSIHISRVISLISSEFSDKTARLPAIVLLRYDKRI